MDTRSARWGLQVPLTFGAAIAATAIMMALDAYDWFYDYSRRHEAYDLDEVTTFLTLFLVGGLLLLSTSAQRRARRALAMHQKAEQDLADLNRRLESLVELRTAQLAAAVEARRQSEKRLEANQVRLRALADRLGETEARERRRLASELHDNIGQTLAIVSNQVGILQESPCPVGCRKAMTEIGDRVMEAIRYARTLTAELNSTRLDHLSLDAAVARLAEEILEGNRIATRVEVEGGPQLACPAHARHLNLALREVLVNIVKHARARCVRLSVGCRDGWTLVEVADDGIGFEPRPAPVATGSARAPRASLGLQTVRERIARVGGSVSIDSARGRGTRVRFRVPSAGE